MTTKTFARKTWIILPLFMLAVIIYQAVKDKQQHTLTVKK